MASDRPASVDAYLSALAPDRRVRFETLLACVRGAVGDASEVIAYDMPAWKLGGRFVCSIGAFARWDSLFPASAVVLERLGDEAARHAKGRGTFQFPLREPLPLELVARIVAARLAEVRGEA